jgi:hypothetical protein
LVALAPYPSSADVTNGYDHRLRQNVFPVSSFWQFGNPVVRHLDSPSHDLRKSEMEFSTSRFSLQFFDDVTTIGDRALIHKALSQFCNSVFWHP